MRPLARLPMLAATILLVGCGGSQVSTVIERIGDGPSIAAADLHFDRSELVVPADAAFSLLFDNRESAPHNVAIYVDETASTSRFVGDVFSGPGSRLYEVPALAAGSYFFRCDVHHDMTGTLIARS